MAVIHTIDTPKDNSDDALLVRKLYYSNNDKIKKNDELIDLETSKTAIIIEAPIDGYIEYVVTSGQSVSIGETVIHIHDEPFTEKTTGENSGDTDSSAIDFSRKIISKQAQQYITDNKIDISHIKKHFVTLADVDERIQTISQSTPKPKTLPGIPKSNKSNLAISTIDIGLAKQKEIMALSGVQLSGLVSTLFIIVEARPISFRYSSDIFKESDSYLPIIIYEVARLLKQFPLLNAFYDNGQIRTYDNVNVGIAMDIDDGLKVCTIRDTDSMTMPTIEQELSKNIDDYMDKRLKPEQIMGSTFTITDLSSFGVDGIIPLINMNQSAILGISKTDDKLNRFNISLAFDHRVTEGKVAGLFLSELKERIYSHTGLLNNGGIEPTQTDSICSLCRKSLEEDRTLGGIGLIQIVDHNGQTQMVCRTCFDGW